MIGYAGSLLFLVLGCTIVGWVACRMHDAAVRQRAAKSYEALFPHPEDPAEPQRHTLHIGTVAPGESVVIDLGAEPPAVLTRRFPWSEAE